MNRFPLRYFVVLVLEITLFFGLAWSVDAQDYSLQGGAPPFAATDPVELGFVNLANGNLHIEIPLGSYPQRGGQPFRVSLVYDSRNWWTTCANAWTPYNIPEHCGGTVGYWTGWRLVTSADRGRNGGWTLTHYNCTGPHGGYKNKNTKFAFYFPDGSAKSFPSITTWYVDSNCQMDGTNPVPTGSGYASDGSGYQLKVTEYSVETVYAPDGTQVATSYNYPTNNPIDTNGNYESRVSLSDQTNIDTLSRHPVTTTSSCNGNASQTCYDVLNSLGTTSRWTLTTTSVPVSTNFGILAEFSGNITVVQSILLPDGTSYSFGYDSGTTPGHFGELTSITLPTGGQINYGYSLFHGTGVPINRWITSRTSGGATWSYTPQIISTCSSAPSTCQQQVTVAKPNGDNTVFTFDFSVPILGIDYGPGLTKIQSYAGSVAPANLMATVTATWNSTYTQKLSETTALPVPGGTSISKTKQFTYDPTYGWNTTQISEWKYYTGSLPATPDLVTTMSYTSTNSNYVAKNITNKPTSMTIKTGGGTQLAQTNYSYDSTSLVLKTGTSNHDDVNFGTGNTVRGNLTQTQRWVVGSTFVSTTETYDTTGQVTSIVDPNGNSTTYNFTDRFFTDASPATNPPATYVPATPTNAYLTSLTLPVVGTSNFGYYFGTGKQASATDPNGADNYRHFLDALDRQTHAYGPQIGSNRPWTLNIYASTDLQLDSYLGIADTSASSSCISCRHDQTILDSFGRVVHSSLINDPDGQTTIDNVYDSNGRTQSTSHPHRTAAAPTDGLETPTYDGLDRTIKVTHPDNAYSQVFYGSAVGTAGLNARTSQSCSSTTYGLGYPVVFVDEAGKKREVWTDGFGRTIEGDEPDSGGNLSSGSATCYLYDGVGNLLTVASGTQTRTYAYDGLSRVTSISIPEVTNSSGQQCATTYSYDNNGNVLTRVASIPGQQTCTSTVTTTYGYDQLNRLTQISYSDGVTPTVKNGYDGNPLTGCSTSPPALTDAYSKGHRTSMCDGSGATSWSHNAAGRVLSEARTILGVTKTISYSYNLDGSVSTITYPSTKQITYTVSAAQRLGSAVDNASGTQFAVAATYAATGALQSVIAGKISGGFTGVTESRGFNNRLEYTSTQATSSAGTAMSLGLAYNITGGNNGSVSGVTNNVDTGRTQSVSYDWLNRVSVATSQATSGVDCWGQSFSPDSLANLNTIASVQCTNGTLSVAVDGNNHITGGGFAYDAAGNMTQDGSGYTYAFDPEKHLKKAVGMAGGPYCYVYDGNGLRVAKKSGAASDCSGGTIVKLYWRSLSRNTLAETDSTGNTTNAAYNEYVFFPGRRIASRNGSGGIFYYFPDQIGTSRTVTTGNGTGQTAGQLCYDADFTPYGQEMQHTERLQTTACPPNYRFADYEYDSETGLNYAFARHYSARLGRFLSADPLGGDVGDLQSHNAYAYVENNPTNQTDPTGLQAVNARNPDYYWGYYGVWANPYTKKNCEVDGAEMNCGMAFNLIAHETAAICPNNNCSNMRFTADGWKQWTSYQSISMVRDCHGSFNNCQMSSVTYRTYGGDYVLLPQSKGTSAPFNFDWGLALLPAGRFIPRGNPARGPYWMPKPPPPAEEPWPTGEPPEIIDERWKQIFDDSERFLHGFLDQVEGLSGSFTDFIIIINPHHCENGKNMLGEPCGGVI